jgi:hypothetical protein
MTIAILFLQRGLSKLFGFPEGGPPLGLILFTPTTPKSERRHRLGILFDSFE